MKQALVNGKVVTAAPDAPATAACPHCDGAVKLRSLSAEEVGVPAELRIDLGEVRPLAAALLDAAAELTAAEAVRHE